MNNTEVITVLSGLLQDASELTDIRVAAADGLGFAGFTSARDTLWAVAQNEQTELPVRIASIRALGQTLHTSK